jgi:hypothetical protein
MRWTPLPTGPFTGIDWATPGATAGFDPYLVWAEADNFAGYGRNKPPKWLPLLLELAPGVSVARLKAASSAAWLHVPPVYTSHAAPTGLRYCTARVRPPFFRHIQAGGTLHDLVARFELGLPAGPHADDPTQPTGPTSPAQGPLLRGKVLGIIDGGLAFAHANFLRNGRTRIRHFWRQDRAGVGTVPAALGYGHELTGAEIDRVMQANVFGGLVDETAVYAHFQMGMELNKRINHGTHVLDIAAGPRTVLAQIAGAPPFPEAPPTWAMANDDASRCDILAVQLDWDTVLDTSGGSMNVHIMDGLMYMLSRCESSARLVVNLSWGTLSGPHDGSSVLEAAMDQLIGLKAGRLQIILPASNSYQARTHANATLSRGESLTLHWRGQPDDETQSFLELWIPQGARGVTVQVTPPGRAGLPPLAWGESGTWNNTDGKPLCALIYPTSVAIGANGTCTLLALTPTFSFGKHVATAPAGIWQVTLRNTGVGQVTSRRLCGARRHCERRHTPVPASPTLKTSGTTPAATPARLSTTPTTLRPFGAAVASTALPQGARRFRSVVCASPAQPGRTTRPASPTPMRDGPNAPAWLRCPTPKPTVMRTRFCWGSKVPAPAAEAWCAWWAPAMRRPR